MLSTILIKQHYTPLQHSVDINDPVWKAWRVMKDQSVKHLPVTKAGKIVGVVSDKDIVQISGLNGGQSMPVKDAMSMDPLVVSLDDSLEFVLKKMLLKDQQQAVVVDAEQRIAGLFSWTSAFQFILDFANPNHLSQLLRAN